LYQATRLHQAGKLAEAEAMYSRVLADNPGQPDGLRLLGALYLQLGRADLALPVLTRAARVLPDAAEVHNSRGVALERTGAADAAREAYARATALHPGYVEAHNNLGNVLRAAGELGSAAAAYRAATALRPNDLVAHRGLAAVAVETGDLTAALVCYRRVVELRPDDPATESELLFWQLHDPLVTPAAARDAHLAWARRHADPLTAHPPPHDNDPTPSRRLRVGYVSGDFREHTRARFVEPVLAHHDPAAVEVYCYSDAAVPDATTARIRRYARAWRDTARLDHRRLADLMRTDGVDVLVDLTGHMAGNRLQTFALRPAPVQVAYPGYPCTTGVRAIDCCVTDADRDPPGAEQWYAERLHRLDVTSQCYLPTDTDLPVSPPPAGAVGHVTFASLNKLVKSNAAVVGAWARVLRAVPGSRLMLLGPPAANARVAAAFGRHGVGADRLELVAPRPRRAYLELHARVDVNLDPWPYNGHTTLLDGCWMGVPAVALDGGSHRAREGAAVLRLLGLGEWVATDVDEYVEKAAALAGDRGRLAMLRRGMRDRMQGGPLCDGPALTRRLEAAYRSMWRAWCAGRS
jgi:predicted O-linked N-acetylglucosamine transferase (SPINDLY family)